jgi:glycosyltransferase involved in cell wall biosynthesis
MSNGLKIAVLGHKGIPFGGGIERIAEEIAVRLVERGHDVTVYCRKHYTKSDDSLYRFVRRKHTFSVHTKRLGQITHTFFSLLDCISEGYDIVTIHGFANVALSFVPKLTGIPVVMHLHGFEWDYSIWNRFDKLLFRACQYPLLWFPNAVSTVSKSQQQYFEERFQKEIHYIPNGVEIKPWRHLSLAGRFGVEPNNYFLFVGRIISVKGVEYLIRACNEIDCKLKIVLVGDYGFERGYYERIFALAKPNRNIVFTGRLDQDTVNELYGNAYAVVVPSEIEANPLVVLEALSFGKCVLASDISQIRDVVGDKVFYFKKGDVGDLKAKLDFLIRKKGDVIEKSRGAKDFVRACFDWERIVDQYENLYLKVCSGVQQQINELRSSPTR